MRRCSGLNSSPSRGAISSPVVVANAQSLWRQPGPIRSRTYLGQATVSNTSAFGAHRFKKKLVGTAVSNVSTFGAHTIAARKRSSAIPTRLDQAIADRQHHGHARRRHVRGRRLPARSTAPSANEFWWNGGSSATLKFDLGSAKVIKQARWKQSNSSTHGLFKWQGSNDDSTYTDIGGAFTLGGATVQIHTTLINNETAYRYYR